MKPLYPYQSRAIEQARELRRAGHTSIVLVCPTGGGKTRLGTEIALGAIQRGGRVLWLTHREELCDQAFDAIRGEGWRDIGVIRANDRRTNRAAPLQIASIQTLVARRLRPQAKVVVIDEVHHIKASGWMLVSDAYQNSIRIGLTATPQRMDGSPLGDVFSAMVSVASYSELIELGRLVPCDVIAPLQRLKHGMSMLPSEAYLKHCRGQQCIIFTSSVAMAERTTGELRASGVAAEALSGQTPSDERKALIDRFRAGGVAVLSSCLVLTEGFDAPTVGHCIMARRATHASSYLQMAGRILRASPGKERALLVDLTGAMHDHGMPTMDREYDLDGEGIKKQEKSKKPWQCPQCGCFSAQRFLVCPRCGFQVPPHEQEPVEVEEQEHRLFKAELATEKQLAVLGLKHAGELTKEDASALIEEAIQRRQAGLCTLKQAKILRKYKLRDDMLFDEAKLCISAIAEAGWRRVPEHIMKQFA